MKSFTLLTLIIALAAPAAKAEVGIDGAIAVYQADPDSAYDHLLFADTSQFVSGIVTSGFFINFSAEIELSAVDSAGCDFTVHVVTLGPVAETHSRSFRVEYGLPARITDISGKGGSRLTFELTPLGQVTFDSSDCLYSHRAPKVFEKSPSAHLDIYFMPNSLGDYYWSTVRGIMEEQYDRVQALHNFTLPGKYDLYLCPCYLPSVIWDKRFGMAVDPTRNTAHVIFNHSLNAADPFVVAYTAVLRNYGYAPPFLSEGLANYLSFALFDMKDIKAQGKDMPLERLLDTYQYYTADPYVSDRTAATFVMFLVNEYGWGRFKKLYQAADDLNLRRQIEQQYGRSIGELAQDWRTYVDTSSIDPNGLVYYAGLAEAMFNYPLMLRYAKASVGLSPTHQDSVVHWSRLKRAFFYNGDYYSATEAQQTLVTLESSSPLAWMTLGSYRMMDGLYNEAYDDLKTAFDLDSTNHNVRFNLAMNFLHRGEDDSAVTHLTWVVDHPDKSGPNTGAMIMLAEILRRSDDENQLELAKHYYSVAIQSLEMALQTNSPAPSLHMWLGISYLALGDLDRARSYLEGALFLETRPFYLGMIQLWLGKLADVSGEREKAIEHYAEVLALPSADYDQREANKYIETPYRQ